MSYFWSKDSLFYKTCSILLIFLHLFAFGPIRDAFAFNAQSTSYRLSSGALTHGGKDHSGASAKIWQGSLGEPCAGKLTSSSYTLNSGFIPTVQTNPPVQTHVIPNFTWKENESMPDAFDLDNYFVSPEGLALTYTVSGANKINVEIKPSYTKLLLHSDGIDGSTNFTDVMGHAIFANGNAQIDTAQFKFGGASALFDGAGDGISVADSADWYWDGDF